MYLCTMNDIPRPIEGNVPIKTQIILVHPKINHNFLFLHIDTKF